MDIENSGLHWHSENGGSVNSDVEKMESCTGCSRKFPGLHPGAETKQYPPSRARSEGGCARGKDVECIDR